MTSRIQVYGTNWCGFTFGLREHLMHSRVDYEYFDIDADSEADEFVRTMNDGKRKYPMVVVEERILMNPTVGELQKMLEDQQLATRARPNRNTRRTGDHKERRSA